MSDMQMTQPAASFRFSTDDIPRLCRPGALNALQERGIFPIEPLAGCDVRVDIIKWTGSGLRILFGTLEGVRQHCLSCHAVGEVLFGIGLSGRAAVLHGGREQMIRRGDVFTAAAERKPFAVVRPLPTQFLGIRIPESLLASRITDLEAGIKLMPGATATKLLAAYARSLLGRGAMVPEAQLLFASHVVDLAAHALDPTQDALAAAEYLSLPAVRLQVIKSDILSHVQDDALDVQALAARHQITPRYVHLLFEREGLTYSQFVLQQRLDRANRLLRNPRWAHLAISTIAYEVGFGDLSYFNRTFRRRYNQTPTDARVAAGVR